MYLFSKVRSSGVNANPNSIFNALPSQKIHITLNHTYVTLTSVIDYFLEYGHTSDCLYHNDDVS